MNRAITISREYGSGGREIGEKLAQSWEFNTFMIKIDKP